MISAIVETIWRQQRIRQVLLASTIFDPCLSRFDGSRRLISELALKLTHALPPGHLKLVRFPAHSPLPIAALPSMSRVPRAPLKLVCFPAHLPLPTAALPSMSLSPKAPFPCSRRVLCLPRRSVGEGGSLIPFALLCRVSSCRAQPLNREAEIRDDRDDGNRQLCSGNNRRYLGSRLRFPETR